MFFDKTFYFDDGVILEVFINSDGDLESSFFESDSAYEDGDADDGSIYDGDLSILLSSSDDEILKLVCDMSDWHGGYEKVPYAFIKHDSGDLA